MKAIEPKLFLSLDGKLSKLPFQLSDYEEKLMNCYKIRKNQFSQINIYQSLKLAMQPVLESLILFDRCAFLIENNCKVDVIPIFDELISPRNVAIIAKKI